MLWRHLHDEPPRAGDGVPAGFDPVIRRALAKDPDERYPSAGALGRAALAAAGEAVSEQPERQVARGPAAPTAEPEAQTAIAGGSPTAATAAVPAPAARRSRAPLVALGALAIAAVAVVAALAL